MEDMYDNLSANSGDIMPMRYTPGAPPGYSDNGQGGHYFDGYTPQDWSEYAKPRPFPGFNQYNAYDEWGNLNKNGYPGSGKHGSDEFKRLNHITFSDQSRGSIPGPVRPGIPQGGHWGTEIPGRGTFTPSKFNLEQHPMDEMRDYFNSREPNLRLIDPNGGSSPTESNNNWPDTPFLPKMSTPGSEMGNPSTYEGGPPDKNSIFAPPTGKKSIFGTSIMGIAAGLGIVANAMNPKDRPGQGSIDAFENMKSREIQEKHLGIQEKTLEANQDYKKILSETNQQRFQKMLQEDTNKKKESEALGKLAGSTPGTPEHKQAIKDYVEAGGTNAEVLKSLVGGEGAGAYKTGHVQSFDTEGGTTYREWTGQGQGWKDRPDLGGKKVKGYEKMEEAIAEAKRIHALTPEDSALIPSAEMGPQGKWIPKMVPDITKRIPPMAGDANLPPNVSKDRRTGKLIEYDPKTNTTRPYNPSEGVPQAALNWDSLKKSAATINGPVFKRLIDNGQILAEGVVNPQTGQRSRPELDQVADLRDQIDDGLFGKINNSVQKFNQWDQFVKYQLSDPQMARFKSKVMANVDTLANVYSGGGTVTSDFKMQFAQELFAAGLSKQSFRAKMETHKESVIDRVRKYSSPNAAVYSGTLTGFDEKGIPIAESKGQGSSNQYAPLIKTSAKNYGVDPDLVSSVIGVESSFKPGNVNSKSGATGLGQFMPGTWQQYGKGKDIKDPQSNIDATAHYLSDLLKKHKGNQTLALAEYNGGRLPKETLNYIQKVSKGVQINKQRTKLLIQGKEYEIE